MAVLHFKEKKQGNFERKDLVHRKLCIKIVTNLLQALFQVSVLDRKRRILQLLKHYLVFAVIVTFCFSFVSCTLNLHSVTRGRFLHRKDEIKIILMYVR